MNRKEKKRQQSEFLDDSDTEDSDDEDLSSLHSSFIHHTVAFSQVHSPSITLSVTSFIASFITSFTTFFHSQFSTPAAHIKLQQWQQRFIKHSRQNFLHTEFSAVQALITMFESYIQQEDLSQNTEMCVTETRARALKTEMRLLKTQVRVNEAEWEWVTEREISTWIDWLKTQLNTQTNQILVMLSELKKNLT